MFTINSQKDKPLCIYGVFRPLYIIARVFGFFPFSLNLETNDIRFTTIDLFVFVVQVAIYSCTTYLNIIYNLVEFLVMSALLAQGLRIGVIFGLLNSIAFLFADLCHRHQAFDIFILYQDFDLQMRFFGSTLNNTQIKRHVHIYVFVWIAISVVYAGVSLWIMDNFFNFISIALLFLSFFISTAVFGVALSIYAFLIFNIRMRFRLLNETLRKLPIKTADVSVVKVTNKASNLLANIMKLAELHDKLNTILDLVNKCYSIQAMFAFAVSFTFVVFSFFGIYRGWTTNTGNNEQFLLSVVLTMWASYYMFFVMNVLWAGQSSKSEGKFTAVLVHRAINKCHDMEVIERLMAFSNQISHRIPDANCKLFSFDWTLLFSIVAATSTYLIILIQFDASGYKPPSFGINNFTLLVN
ncbi:putative gustatory receptor 28b [Bradysia coprophila]|uniref:putative gustatory receptor 28b n=1 Tax=Bradysia coprophila TaxID=38358 RepID=UPI00187DD97D|nr:putative gustatory receptor 28b [Bradysia coprophila]